MAAPKKGYNCTQLTPQQEFERHIYHRDQFAHYLRWTHVLRDARIGQTILDFGCGTGVLGILSCKCGATQAIGIDIDKWSVECANNNCRLNH